MQEYNINILPSVGNYPPGKLADAELHFKAGPLAGLKLVGFAVWSSYKAAGGVNVTFPSRQYNVGKEKRTFVLLRGTTDQSPMGDQLKDAIGKAYLQALAQLSAQAQKHVAGELAVAQASGSMGHHGSASVAQAEQMAGEAEAGIAIGLAELL